MSDLLNIVCQTLDEKQAENIVTIDMRSVNPVSYTHLTLPTICSV